MRELTINQSTVNRFRFARSLFIVSLFIVHWQNDGRAEGFPCFLIINNDFKIFDLPGINNIKMMRVGHIIALTPSRCDAPPTGRG